MQQLLLCGRGLYSNDDARCSFRDSQSPLPHKLGFTAAMFADGRRVRRTGDAHREGKNIARWHTFTFAEDNHRGDTYVFLVDHFADSDLVAQIRSRSICRDNSIEQCCRLTAQARAQTDRNFPDEPGLW